MSRIGKYAHPRARRRRRHHRRPHVTVKGPKGTLERDLPGADHRPPGRRRRSLVERPDDERQNRALHGLDPLARQQHGRRRHRRLHARSSRSSASATAPPPRAPTSSSWPSASATRCSVEAPDGITFEVPTPDPHRGRRASTRSWSARSPPTSARSASPSPTRARASATPASTSPARPARPAK